QQQQVRAGRARRVAQPDPGAAAEHDVGVAAGRNTSVFAAARISVPGALIGALIGEWLGSGTGLGASLIRAIPTFQYNKLWASIVIVTIVSVALYAIVGVIENLVLARFGPDAGRS
uniref:ABC transporter permease subunit n=1 Tax=Nocardia sp. TaxID=1821 RepID=UPI002587E695